MIKKLLCFVSLLSAGVLANKAEAQVQSPSFTFPFDTVCVAHEFVPNVLTQNASTYAWSFCPPILGARPDGQTLGFSNFQLVNNNAIAGITADGFEYLFSVNSNGLLMRYQFVNGIDALPVTTDMGHFGFSLPNLPTGIQVLKMSNGTHSVFVMGKTNGITRLFRIDFANGLNNPATYTYIYSLPGLNNPKELFVGYDQGKLYAFTFEDGNDLVRLDFNNSNIDQPVAITNLGNTGEHLSNVSDIAPIYENGNWHFIVTSRDNNKLVHITFGNSLSNNPFMINLGGFNNRIRVPSAISITKDCNDYYGYVLNENTSEWTTLYWNESIADVPVATPYNTNMGLNVPLAMSNTFRTASGLHMFITNGDNTLTHAKFPFCTNASVQGSNQMIPPPVSYDKSGMYSVFLTTDEGLPSVKSFCKTIYVKDHPEYTINNDTAICAGDTISIQALTYGTDSITWTPNYNIDTTEGRFVKLWPEYPTNYDVHFYYAPECNVKHTLKVHVDRVIADAGQDRNLSDGTTLMVGGANTTVNDSFTYVWTPDVFFQSNRFEPTAYVRPANNITYYLTVTAPSGCKAIDSVYVRVPCDNINMPNAFVPSQGGKFGIKNLQITQMNYYRIYDRWGREVFETTNPSQEWNGLDKDGILCDMGVYVWEIDAYCKDTNERYRKSGTVTLIK